MSRRIAIFTDDPGWHGARLREAFAARGCESRFASLADCRLAVAGEPPVVRIPGFEPRLPDGAFVRGVPAGTLEEVVFHLNVLHALRELGVPVYNDGRAIERSVDKALTTLTLARAGLPVPATWVTRDAMHAWSVMLREHRAGHTLVCKPLFGSQGEGVVRIAPDTSLPDSEPYNGVYYLQRFLDSGEGRWHDWRVFVVGGRAVAAMRREGGGWVNNVARGARCRPVPVDGTLRTLAEAAVDAVGMHYAGVDLLQDTRGRWWLLEVNSIPAWKGLQGVCDVDVAQTLADDFLASVAASAARLEVVG